MTATGRARCPVRRHDRHHHGIPTRLDDSGDPTANEHAKLPDWVAQAGRGDCLLQISLVEPVPVHHSRGTGAQQERRSQYQRSCWSAMARRFRAARVPLRGAGVCGLAAEERRNSRIALA